MKASNNHQRHATLLFSVFAVLALSACSGSSGGTDGIGDDSAVLTPDVLTTDIPAGDASQTAINDEPSTETVIANGDTENGATNTLVTFDITVPRYTSNSLQVHIDWGADRTDASWVVDESWTANGNMQTDSSYAVTVTFSDDNGAIVLGRANTMLNTTTSSNQTLEVLASQFDTTNVDDDGDGISNLDELIAGTNPLQPAGVANNNNDAPPPYVDARIELIADKTVRIHWQRTPAADYYRILENVDGNSGYEAISDDLDATVDQFDHRIALHRRFNARYMVEACNTSGCSFSVQQLVEALDGFMEEGIGYFESDNPEENNKFGSAVSLSADGQTLAVGDSRGGNAENNTANNAGAVHVFQRSNGQWILEQRLLVSTGDNGDEFGNALELSADGNTLVVGAPGEDSTATGVNGNSADNSTDASGAAYVFVRRDNQWQQQAYLKASNTPSAEVYPGGINERFGGAVAISADGHTIVVGATGEDSGATGINGDESDNSEFYTGAAYVFVVDDGLWSQQAYIKASTSAGLRAFGLSVSLNSDGNTFAVGAYNSFTPATTTVASRGPDWNTFYGAVYVFTRSNSTWQQQAILRPSENEYGWRRFGEAIDLSDDGDTLVAKSDNDVYVLERQNSIWQPTQRLVQSNLPSEDTYYPPGFGAALSISGDGSTVAISWPQESSASTGVQGYQGSDSDLTSGGAAYIFEKEAGSWQQSAFLKASNPNSSYGYGYAISLDWSGDTVAVSAANQGGYGAGILGESGFSLRGAGAVYLY